MIHLIWPASTTRHPSQKVKPGTETGAVGFSALQSPAWPHHWPPMLSTKSPRAPVFSASLTCFRWSYLCLPHQAADQVRKTPPPPHTHIKSPTVFIKNKQWNWDRLRPWFNAGDTSQVCMWVWGRERPVGMRPGLFGWWRSDRSLSLIALTTDRGQRMTDVRFDMRAGGSEQRVPLLHFRRKNVGWILTKAAYECSFLQSLRFS